MLVVNMMFWFLSSFNSKGQVLTWNTEVGCERYYLSEGVSSYAEHIQEGTCLYQSESSQTIFSLQGNSSTWVSTVWNVSGGNVVLPTTTTCKVNWMLAGLGSISATVTTNTGAVISIPVLCVEKIKKPKALFQIFPNAIGTSSIEVCLEESIQFTNLSHTNGGTAITSYHWSFGDGATSTAFEPTHVYTESGTYKVHLQVKNACNCVSTYAIEVIVGNPGIDILCPSVVCEGQIATYSLSNRDLPCELYDWQVKGGTITSPLPYGSSIQVNWDALGTHDDFGYVTFYPKQCEAKCLAPVTVKIPVIKNKTNFVGETQICTNNQYVYKLPQWPTTDFVYTLDNPNDLWVDLLHNDERNEIIITTHSDFGHVVLNATYTNTLLKCGGKASLDIDILPPNEIVGLQNVCLGATETYTLTTPDVAIWTLTHSSGSTTTSTGTSFSPVFNTLGNYTLTVTMVSGTGYCAVKPIGIKAYALPVSPNPSLVLGHGLSISDTACPGLATVFTYNNTNPNISIGWSVSNGTIITADHGNQISAVFGLNPNLPCTLSVWQENIETPNCRSALVTIPIYLPNLNFAIIGENTVCSSTVQTYSVPFTEAESYLWSVVTPGGLPSTAGSISSGNGTPNVTVQWNLFPVTTTAVLKLTFIKCGTTFARTFPVTIVPGYTLNLNSLASVCRGTAIYPTLQNPPATFTTISWDFGDGSPAMVLNASDPNALTPSYTYPPVSSATATPNNYTIVVKIEGANGCIATAMGYTNILVNPNPVASIPYAGVIFCTEQELINYGLQLTVSSQAGMNYQWFLNGLSLSGDTLATHTVMSSGRYKALVTNPITGCSVYTNEVWVHSSCDQSSCALVSNPVVTLTQDLNASGYTNTTNCNKVTVTATYTTTDATNPSWITSVIASFTESITVVSPNTIITRVYTFANPGLYSVNFNVSYPSAAGGFCPESRHITHEILVPYKSHFNYAVTCGSTNGYYNVTLTDNSSFTPNTPPEGWQFYAQNTTTGVVTNLPLQTGAALPLHTGTFTDLPPGTYIFGLTLSATSLNDCSFTSDPVVLPNLPDATFTVTPACGTCTSVCVGTNLHFAVTNPAPNQTYLWSFGDGSQNGAVNPDKTYNVGSVVRIPSLTITNQYGCISTYTLPVGIVVNKNDLSGDISPNDGMACAGNAVALTFNDTSASDAAVGYQWMNNLSLIPGATTASYNATQTGLYWVQVSNANGCKADINGVGVHIFVMPVAKISGPATVCASTTFSLTALAGAGSTTQYEWLLDGVVVSTFADNLTMLTDQYLYLPGTYTYTLNVRIPDGSGGYCTTSATKIITVLEAPDTEPTIDVTIDCAADYTVVLHVNPTWSYAGGTYTWSNGASGQTIVVHEGGVYQVRYTNPGGCSITKQIEVPKNPERYLWVFPKGCYTLCGKINNPFLLGPSSLNLFDSSWNTNGSPANNGTGQMPNFPLGGSDATYSMMLNNGYCSLTSPDMSVTIVYECVSCNLNPVIDYLSTEYSTYCYHKLKIGLSNPSATPITVTFSSTTNGIFVPSSVVVPPGGSSFLVDYIPTETEPSDVLFYFEGINEHGEKCRDDLWYTLPTCSLTPIAPNLKKGATLLLVPNPAQGETTITFEYPQEKGTNQLFTLELYDLMGHRLNAMETKTPQGDWKLNVQDYPAGLYVVVLKENGVIRSQKKLVKL